jgi:uncharacterized OsmC-like protein
MCRKLPPNKFARTTALGDFDEAQRKRLAQIAQRCPVHKTLAYGVSFEDSATFGHRRES